MLIRAKKIRDDISIENFNHDVWKKSKPIQITKYWSGEDAPIERHTEVCALWSDDFLYVRFVCNQNEPLIINNHPQTKIKTDKLWERDVCEIFIAPDVNEPRRYFEFEAAPTGEWLDLEICQLPERRETNWQYESNMIAAAKIENEKVMMTIRIPFSSLRFQPKANERRHANLFRCVGVGETRGYLAWQPTRTEKPDFHVPEAFGWIVFEEDER
jgi:hypothetical protein